MLRAETGTFLLRVLGCVVDSICSGSLVAFEFVGYCVWLRTDLPLENAARNLDRRLTLYSGRHYLLDRRKLEDEVELFLGRIRGVAR